MPYIYNPFTGSIDFVSNAIVPDPLTINNLTVNQLATINHIHGNIAGNLYVHVKNTSNETLPKGTPVYITGSVGDTTTLEVAKADASISNKRPAIALLDQQLTHNQTGNAAMFGEMTGLATNTYSIGQELYLASGGGLTNVKPTTDYVQSLAVVGRVHANTGTILVWTASGTILP